jgi:hypothetical protein
MPNKIERQTYNIIIHRILIRIHQIPVISRLSIFCGKVWFLSWIGILSLKILWNGVVPIVDCDSCLSKFWGKRLPRCSMKTPFGAAPAGSGRPSIPMDVVFEPSPLLALSVSPPRLPRMPIPPKLLHPLRPLWPHKLSHGGKLLPFSQWLLKRLSHGEFLPLR